MADVATRVMREGLTGLARRQRLIAANVANLDTPGYRPVDLRFEQVLGRRMREEPGGQLVLTSAMHIPGPGPADLAVDQIQVSRQDAEGVDVDYEMARLSEAVIEYNAVTQLLTARMAMLRSAVTEGRR